MPAFLFFQAEIFTAKCLVPAVMYNKENREGQQMEKLDALALAMIDYDQGDPKRIHHF